MSRRTLVPSISLLEAFEASARHRSFTLAADELALTQSAVSRQVQALEEQLDVPLFRRTGRRIVLTDIGQAYAREIAAALARIRTASSRAISFRTGAGSLQLAIQPTFGSKWLVPRLGSFYARHPGMLVHIHSRIGEIDIDQSGMDAVIAASDGHRPGLVAHHLLEDERVVIISPELLARRPLQRPEQLLDHLLLEVSTRPQSWRDWMVGQGLSVRGVRMGPQFEFTAHLIQSVMSGIGVGLVTRVLVEDEIRSGALIVPFTVPSSVRWHYYLFYPPERESFPPLVAFRDWVLGEARAVTDGAARA